jgi:signal transduction histidine kinase
LLFSTQRLIASLGDAKDASTLGKMVPRMPKGALLGKLLLSTLLPSALAIGFLGFAAHEVARRVLEEELGRRVSAAAAGIALWILPEQLAAIGPGDEASNTYANLRRRAQQARGQLGLRRVFFIALDRTIRADSDGRLPLGGMAHEIGADLPEIERARKGEPASAPLFWGHDGLPYKRGYAAVGQAGFVVVEASAEYLQALASFRRWLLIGAMICIVFIIATTTWFSRRMTVPLVRLARQAQRIGEGQLGTPVVIETQDEIGYLARCLDEMREALFARDERMQMMLAGIAHEVRNPLGGLELFAGLLREGLAGNPERLEEVARIEKEIGYLKCVVTDFQEFARRPTPVPEVVAIFDLLNEVVEVVRSGQPSPKFLVECPSGLQGMGDRGQLRRALVNLAKNAMAAAPTGQVILAAVREGDQIRLEVRDSGPGIPGHLRAKVFTPFFTTREKGTGLGLAFVREIARDHGGEPWIETASEGGAAIGFMIPSAS